MPDITMPQLGETVTEGTITKWFKQVGDEISEDEPLFEVSTDKVDSEVPSPTSGYLAEILVQEGDTVDVGTKLAVISSEAPSGGGDGKAAPAKEEEPEPEAKAKEEPEAEEEAPEEAEEQEVAKEEPPPEKEEKPAKEEPAPAKATDTDGDGDGATGKVLSPVVRRLISEHDIDPSQIKGTGAGGRITRADVLSYIDEGPAKTEAPPKPKKEEKKPEPVAAAPAPAAAAAPAEGDEVIPFTNIRRRTAEHMVRSKATSAHTLTAIEVDYDRVERVRQAAKDEFRQKEGVGLTYLPFIARAVIDAIGEFPNINASVGDDALIVHHAINLGIAVDLDLQGLIVPVIHHAADKRLPALAREIVDLATRARNKKLGADDIAGGTFTITNPGPFGTFLTAPIINQPQVAILSTDGIKKRPVVVELPDGSDGIAIHPTGNLALSFDHRVIDGAYASAFLKQIKDIVESRDWAQEL